MNAVEQVLTSAGWLILDWSVRWGVLIGLLALWLAWRPPQRSEVRHALAWGVLLVGLGLPLTPLWGPGFWQTHGRRASVAAVLTAPPRAAGREADAAPSALGRPEEFDLYADRAQAVADAIVPFEEATGHAAVASGEERTGAAAASCNGEASAACSAASGASSRAARRSRVGFMARPPAGRRSLPPMNRLAR